MHFATERKYYIKILDIFGGNISVLQLSSSELVSGVPGTVTGKLVPPAVLPELTPWPLGLGPRERRPFLTNSELRSANTILGDEVKPGIFVAVAAVAAFLRNDT